MVHTLQLLFAWVLLVFCVIAMIGLLIMAVRRVGEITREHRWGHLPAAFKRMSDWEQTVLSIGVMIFAAELALSVSPMNQSPFAGAVEAHLDSMAIALFAPGLIQLLISLSKVEREWKERKQETPAPQMRRNADGGRGARKNHEGHPGNRTQDSQ